METKLDYYEIASKIKLPRDFIPQIKGLSMTDIRAVIHVMGDDRKLGDDIMKRLENKCDEHLGEYVEYHHWREIYKLVAAHYYPSPNEKRLNDMEKKILSLECIIKTFIRDYDRERIAAQPDIPKI